jgi:hypothetical protein
MRVVLRWGRDGAGVEVEVDRDRLGTRRSLDGDPASVVHERRAGRGHRQRGLLDLAERGALDVGHGELQEIAAVARGLQRIDPSVTCDRIVDALDPGGLGRQTHLHVVDVHRADVAQGEVHGDQLVVVREAVVVAVVGESEALDDEVGRLEERVQNRGDGVLRASQLSSIPLTRRPATIAHARPALDQRAVVVPQAAARPQ